MQTVNPDIKAIFFDFGGVITTSPFDNFKQIELTKGIPENFIRTVNATNANDNAWAKFERNEIDANAFDKLFAAEAKKLGYDLPGRLVLEAIKTTVRPNMVKVLKHLKSLGLKLFCLTNNVVPTAAEIVDSRIDAVRQAMLEFDLVIESSVEGIRKPEVDFYLRALQRADVKAHEVIFLDDLGINLKPAAKLGMKTIKVTTEQSAMEGLQTHLNITFNLA